MDPKREQGIDEAEPLAWQRTARTWQRLGVALAALAGLALMGDSLWRSSATYDEVSYLEVAARWWRTGDQESITRMGSPLTFWKLQQVPVLWALDHTGSADVVSAPLEHQRMLLPLVRIASLWIWLVALLLTAAWSRRLYGPNAMVAAAWLFALSPNLLAHGALVTMELPIVACTVALFFCFWRFLQTSDRRFWLASAVIAGLAWSCKFTTAIELPIVGAIWWLDCLLQREDSVVRTTIRVALGMLAFFFAMAATDFLLTGCALLPMSPRTGAHPAFDGRFGGRLGPLLSRILECPIPQDWVGFATQMRHQSSGGWSYLFGERRMTGWRHYYFVAMAVKVPLTFWLLVAGRACLQKRIASAGRDWILPVAIALFLATTALGSSRNYGVRYLLPLAPLAIVWVSGTAEAGRWGRGLMLTGLLGQAIAVAACHPHELSYFNVLAGGPRGGRAILADSNLDWGQGAKDLARIQAEHPELRDLTLYYFGNTDPAHYGVAGTCYVIDAGEEHPDLPRSLEPQTEFVAVSASLQFGPWGPADYFKKLGSLEPVLTLPDYSMAIYRSADLEHERQPLSAQRKHEPQEHRK